MERLVITTPDDLLNALPHVLGFEPRNSLITVPFRGGGMTARVDIPTNAEERRGAIGTIRRAYSRNAQPGDLVAIVCVTDDVHTAQHCSSQLATALEQVGIHTPLRLWATDERWMDLNSGEGGIRTAASAERIAAEAAFAGKAAPATSRQALADSLAGDRGPVAAVLNQARRHAARSGIRAEHEWAIERMERFDADGVRLTDPEAARMLIAIEHKPTRDALWTDMSRDNAASHSALWSDLTRRAPDEVRTPAATMLAFSAWLAGDGAKAWCALEQIPPDSAPYTMATVIATALHHATNPAAWEEAKGTIEGSECFVPARPRPDRGAPSPGLSPGRSQPDRAPPPAA